MENSFDIDNTILIDEVSKCPCLYDNNCKTYTDKIARQWAWDAVCTRVVLEWDDLSTSEQKNMCQLVQRRWRSIRDSFNKYWKITSTPENLGKRRRRYIYHKQMQFIVPVLRRTRNENNWNNEDTVDKEVNDNKDDSGNKDNIDPLNYDEKFEVTVEEADVSPSQKAKAQITEYERPLLRRKRCHPSTFEARVLQIMNRTNLQCSRQNDVEDSDKMFLLSLLPSFKQLTQQDKIPIQIEILQAIQNRLLCRGQDEMKQNVEEIYIEN